MQSQIAIYIREKVYYLVRKNKGKPSPMCSSLTGCAIHTDLCHILVIKKKTLQITALKE